MEIDLRNVDGEGHALAERLRSQVCIIGGGIAGLTLANLLQRSGSVTLLEAGGRAPEKLGGKDPFGAELDGMRHAGTALDRVQALGGCSWNWGGQLLPLPRDADWPIQAAELAEANRLWHVPEYAGSFLRQHGASLPDLLQHFPDMLPRLSRFIPFRKRNLAKSPGRKLLTSRTVKVALHGPVVELELSASGEQVVAARVRLPGGGFVRVQADHFVLAAGTVESCRLLLASRRVAPAGVGNEFGQVGRNFHDHLTLPAAVFTGRSRATILQELRPWILAGKRLPRSVYSLKLEPSPALREQLELLPAMAHLTITEPEGSGVGALRELLRARQQGGVLRTLKILARSAPRIAAQALRLAWQARFRRRRYVSPQAVVQLQLNLAQEMPSASRITLSEQIDESGQPKARVDWRIADGELAALRGFAGYLRAGFESAGYTEGIDWTPALFSQGERPDSELRVQIDDARHAMGGTCMGSDPQRSVVDRDLRVHGVSNLYVASPGAFPNGSPQLPTLTLYALCLRLAAHLQGKLRA